MNTISFASQLATARLRMRQGAALLDSFAVIAFAVSSWLTLTTLGGVWLFWQRMPHVEKNIVHVLGDPEAMQYLSGLGAMYMALAFIALALLTVPLLSLGMAAARLGAQGRAKRLASLRLVGMTAWQVQKVSLIETMVQYVIGFAVGFVLYVVSLLGWQALSFQGKKIEMSEMLLPWWGILVTIVFLAVLAALSTLLGLVRVSISPLGVARRFSPRALKLWRFVFLGAVVIAAIAIFMSINTHYLANTRDAILAIGAAMALVIVGVSIAGPLFIQLTARFGLFTSNGAKLLAARRVIADPRAAWRNVNATALMGLVTALIVAGGFFVISSSTVDNAQRTLQEIVRHDVTTGVFIVFAFTLVLGTVSTLIHQASDVFDRAPEQRVLVNTGVALDVFSAARFRQVIWPYIVTTLFAVVIGVLPGLAYTVFSGQPISSNMKWLAIMVTLGTLITLAAAALTIPIERRVLTMQARRND